MYWVNAVCFLVFWCSGCFFAHAQSTQQQFRVVFYNVENLFHPESGNAYNAFTPDGLMRWNKWRYEDKLIKLGKVVLATGNPNPPALLGLCEIESLQTLEDLNEESPLATVDYDIIHQESPDHRGIDVALFYQKSKFTPIDTAFIPLTSAEGEKWRTREILYCSGLLKGSSDTLHLFINHWPSRYGGEGMSAHKRERAAYLLRQQVEEVLQNHQNPKILIMGDFNDEPFDKSIKYDLAAHAIADTADRQTGLFNLMYPLQQKGLGTYKFQDSWNLLDQFIVNESFFSEGLNIEDYGIFHPEWLYIKDEVHGGRKPYRMYSGVQYLGGFSDHFPIWLDLVVR